MINNINIKPMTKEELEEIDYIDLALADIKGNTYKVTKPVKYWCQNMMVGKWKMYDKKGTLVAEADIDTVTIYPGYVWDGCTIIGLLYEDKYTLQASLLHDILYEVLAVRGYKPVFSTYQADYWFTQLIKIISGYKVLPEVYRAALAILGAPFRKIKGKSTKYNIKTED